MGGGVNGMTVEQWVAHIRTAGVYLPPGPALTLGRPARRPVVLHRVPLLTVRPRPTPPALSEGGKP